MQEGRAHGPEEPWPEAARGGPGSAAAPTPLTIRTCSGRAEGAGRGRCSGERTPEGTLSPPNAGSQGRG